MLLKCTKMNRANLKNDKAEVSRIVEGSVVHGLEVSNLSVISLRLSLES